jgi:branched-chain amino acid transport system substrate-binding protein
VRLAPYLGQLGAARPSAIFAALGGTASATFLTAYHSARLTSQLIGPGPLTEGSVIGTAGAAAAGVFTALNYSPDLATALNRAFAPEYQRSYRRTPTTWAMSAYDAAAVLDRALALAGSAPTPDAINSAVGQLGVIDSPRGTWQFNRSRTPLQKWYLRQVRRDGQVLSNVAISQLLTLG